MKAKLIMTLGLVAMLGICGTAVNAQGRGKGPKKSKGKVNQEAKGGDQKQERKQRRAQYRKMLQEKYPEAMKEIKALRETDKAAAKAKFKALHQKVRAERKANGKQGNKGKRIKMLQEKYPEEMKEIKALRKTDKEASKAKFKALIKKIKAERKAAKGDKKTE